MIVHDAGLQFRGISPNGGKMKTVDTIILHHRAGNGDVESIHKQHMAQGWWGIGYHYYIRKDGSIWRGRPEQWVGSHAGSSNDYNKHSIGICFEGNFEQEQMTDAQVQAGRELIADIEQRYTIYQILGHKDVAKTACPGANFRWDDLFAPDPDYDVPDWALEEFAHAVEIGITDGSNPQTKIPRYQAALMAYRAYKQAIKDILKAIGGRSE